LLIVPFANSGKLEREDPFIPSPEWIDLVDYARGFIAEFTTKRRILDSMPHIAAIGFTVIGHPVSGIQTKEAFKFTHHIPP
jgi:hypothetical protein